MPYDAVAAIADRTALEIFGVYGLMVSVGSKVVPYAVYCAVHRTIIIINMS